MSMATPAIATALAAPPTRTADVAPLPRLFARGLAWTAGARWAAQVSTWAATLLIARFLTPADYGIVAMATVFTGLVAVVSEFGVGSTVVILRHLSDEQLAHLNGLAVIVGAVGGAISVAAAPAVAQFYSRPELVPIVGALATTFVFSGMRTVPAALLQRRYWFRTLAAVEGGQAVAGAAVALAAAASGAGYWSLVISQIAASGLWAGCAMAIAPCRFAWPERRVLTEALTFTRHQLTGNTAWYFYSNADFVIAGRLLGASALGTYGLAWTFARIVPERLASVVMRVAPTFLASVGEDREELRRWMYALTEGVALVTFPLLVGIALTAPDLVALAVGDRWRGAVLPLRLLAIYSAYDVVMQLATRGLVAIGDVRFTARLGIVLAAIMPLGFLIGSRHGAAGIAATWLVLAPLCRSVLLLRARSRLQLSLSRYCNALWPAVRASLAMTVVVLGVRTFAHPATPSVRAGLSIVAGASAYGAALCLGHAPRAAQWFWRIRQISGRSAA